MGGFLLHRGASVRCPDQGSATPLITNSRVRVSGNDTILITTPYSIAGCVRNTPCVTASWIVAAQRVRSLGQPLVLTDSQSTTNNAVPLQPQSFQQRVKGQ